jgi:hypothetical protein
MNLINKMLAKEKPSPCPGSILVGKRFAEKWNNKINELVESENHRSLLNGMVEEVRNDFEEVHADARRRGSMIPNIRDNIVMISMIADFIQSL